jgi:hypothetical protein
VEYITALTPYSFVERGRRSENKWRAVAFVTWVCHCHTTWMCHCHPTFAISYHPVNHKSTYILRCCWKGVVVTSTGNDGHYLRTQEDCTTRQSQFQIVLWGAEVLTDYRNVERVWRATAHLRTVVYMRRTRLPFSAILWSAKVYLHTYVEMIWRSRVHMTGECVSETTTKNWHLLKCDSSCERRRVLTNYSST